VSSQRYEAEQLGPYPDGSYWWVARDDDGVLVSDQHGNLVRWTTRGEVDAWIDRERVLDGQR
jgi:hypothetical protein